MPSDRVTSVDDTEQDGPPYPEARRTYRMLGVVHAVLFGAIGLTRGLENGSLFWGVVGALLFGGMFWGVFWHLSNEHYRGNVPGKPGALYPGENDE